MRRILSAVSIALSLVITLTAFGVLQGNSFTYQGQLRRSGVAYNGTCNMDFSLWDAAIGGSQQAGTVSLIGVNVVNGLFTVALDFGDNRFSGDARWLATSVQCSGDGGFTQLDPRQLITATPYALSLRPGAQIIGSGGLFVNNTQSAGIGVFGAGVNGGRGVFGIGAGAVSAGVYGQNTDGTAIFGQSNGVGSAIHGENTSTGLAGRFSGPIAVENSRSSGIGIDSTAFVGVQGRTTSSGGSGVYGEGLLANSAGVFATNRDSAAIWGRSTGAGSAVFGENTGTGFAGRFVGPVNVQGTLSKSAGSFQIDHPLDPANKYLSHSFVESPDMMNIYNGNVTTDCERQRDRHTARLLRRAEPRLPLSTHRRGPVRAGDCLPEDRGEHLRDSDRQTRRRSLVAGHGHSPGCVCESAPDHGRRTQACRGAGVVSFPRRFRRRGREAHRPFQRTG